MLFLCDAIGNSPKDDRNRKDGKCQLRSWFPFKKSAEKTLFFTNKNGLHLKTRYFSYLHVKANGRIARRQVLLILRSPLKYSVGNS